MDYTTFRPVIYAAGVLEKKIKREAKADKYYRILYVASGDVTVSPSGEKPQKLSSGGFCLIPPAVPYAVRAGMCRLLTVAFDGVEATFPFDRFLTVADYTEESEKLLSVIEIFDSETKTSGALAAAVLTELLLALAEEKDENALPTRLVRKLDAYIAENHEATISNTEIAAVFGYHPFYISQMMKKKTGLTLRQYVANYRLRLAKTLLQNTDFSVAEIAEQIGFGDASYFTKTFKKECGVTPKEYRKNRQDGEL